MGHTAAGAGAAGAAEATAAAVAAATAVAVPAALVETEISNFPQRSWVFVDLAAWMKGLNDIAGKAVAFG
eukprot:CAMPEP_0173258540 /NCGR_PEP_ID=MMETSP1142-20121109/24437_1 /TAXON_ID=483371 /ORGANISM="non described non described, Strain CCMP2298" /LENGTH=69 /DNA_ID=CAMNT_0014192901 /DNA_START=56 /DNA_END=261 /DNA_ORIENTATION=-